MKLAKTWVRAHEKTTPKNRTGRHRRLDDMNIYKPEWSNEQTYRIQDLVKWGSSVSVRRDRDVRPSPNCPSEKLAFWYNKHKNQYQHVQSLQWLLLLFYHPCEDGQLGWWNHVVSQNSLKSCDNRRTVPDSPGIKLWFLSKCPLISDKDRVLTLERYLSL